jgi:dienelactone hydrolase
MNLRRIARFCFAAFTLCTALAQKIEVSPSTVMIDEVASVSVTGLTPGSHATIRAELTDGEGSPWAAEADFVADAQGTVDTAKQAPVAGSYRTVSSLGLIWSMRPTRRGVHIYALPRAFASQTIRFHLLVDGKEVSSAQLEQIAVRPGVQQIQLEGSLHGTLFLPGTAGKHPAILVVGGSEGGQPGLRAAWLASHGYVALALCYFRCEGMPQSLERIPLEYFGEALLWMSQRPEVNSGRLGVMGTSRGGELALQLGSMYSVVKAVVAFVPANVRYPSCCNQRPGPSWTWKGQPLAWSAPWLNNTPPTNAEIAVEQTRGPILMIGAESDNVWPSAQMVDAVDSRLRANHFPYQVVVLKYSHAGHRAGLPEIVPAWNDGVTHPVSGRHVEFGGTPEGNAESSLDAIPRVLDFLRKSLLEPATTE